MNMKQIQLEELRIIQMDILSAVHIFCKTHGIRYSLACGSLLGAARHKGYIPWDDDIDIYLLREDYEKMIKIFPDLLEDKYKFCTLERCNHWSFPYGKIMDVRTVIYEGDESDDNMGVNIDIFPVDYVPDDEDEWLKYDKQRRKCYHYYEIRKYLKVFRFNKNKNTAINIAKICIKLPLSFISTRFMARIVQMIAKKFYKKKSERVFECAQGIYQKRPFPKVLFENIIMLPFEDRYYMCFSDYDTYLSNAFGNWKELPPIEKRQSHHIFTAWWKNN